MPNHIVECRITLNIESVFYLRTLDCVTVGLVCRLAAAWRAVRWYKKNPFFGSMMVSMSRQLQPAHNVLRAQRNARDSDDYEYVMNRECNFVSLLSCCDI
jgi:hypothetical protein